MKTSRRAFLIGLASLPVAALASGCYMRLLEPDWFEITEKDIELHNLRSQIKILHLSDFHASPEVSFSAIETAIDKSLTLNADVALLTGDYITSNLPDPIEYRRILRKLSDAMPTYACVGNHDGGSWAGRGHGYTTTKKVSELLNSSGIRLLFNQKHNAVIRAEKLTIVGLGDLWSQDCKPEEILRIKREEENPILVLSHNPDSKELLKKFDWDVMFCGHTHGGQLVVPIIGARPFLPVQDTSFPEGLREIEGKHIHITRGIGNLHGMRFNCRPEISILNLKPTKSQIG